jgi:DNA-binding response OmpR family regulator
VSAPDAASAFAAARGTVLVADDERATAETVARHLRESGYEVRLAPSGPAALAAIRDRRPDVLVLDVVLPGVDGWEVMRRVRRLDRAHPAIVVLSARGEASDRIVGLRLGADDYVVKPFSAAEVVARVDAIMRRVDPRRSGADVIEVGPLRIDLPARAVTRDGRSLALTQREFDLLVHLARHPGRAFSRDELMGRVWQYAFYTDTSTVTVTMRRLRAKIEADPAHPRYLQTVRGVGYRLRADSH